MIGSDFEAEVRNNLTEFSYGVKDVCLVGEIRSAENGGPSAVLQVISLEGDEYTIEMTGSGYTVTSGCKSEYGDQFETLDQFLHAYSPDFVAQFNNQLMSKLFAAATERERNCASEEEEQEEDAGDIAINF